MLRKVNRIIFLRTSIGKKCDFCFRKEETCLVHMAVVANGSVVRHTTNDRAIMVTP